MDRDMRLEIVGAVLELGVLLLRKNAGYGNSAADPLMVFSKLGAVERLGVRMDDKLSRITRGREDGQEDTRGDLAGYLVLDGIVRGMRDGAEPREVGDVLALWGEVLGRAGLLVGLEELNHGDTGSTGEEEESRGGAEAQREEWEELEGMSKEDREDWEAKAGREEDARKGAEPQRGAGEERGERRGGLEMVMGDGEVCVRVPVGLWERTLEEAEESRRAAEAQREKEGEAVAVFYWRARAEECRRQREELVEELKLALEQASEWKALVRKLEESRNGAEAQRGAGGMEQVGPVVNVWSLLDDAQVYQRGLEEELERERWRSWGLAEELDFARWGRRVAGEQRDEVLGAMEVVLRSRDVLREGFVELQEEGKRLEAHGVRLQEELNALVRAHEEGEEDSRNGAEAQREEGKGEEDSRRGAEPQREEGAVGLAEGVAGGARLITDH